MGVRIDSTIEKQIQKIIKEQPKIAEKSLRKSGREYASILSKTTPVSNIKKSDRKHAKDYTSSSFKMNEGSVYIGFTKDVAWRIKFVENGTIKQKPQRFIEKTERANRERMKNNIQEDILRGFGL